MTFNLGYILDFILTTNCERKAMKSYNEDIHTNICTKINLFITDIRIMIVFLWKQPVIYW